MPVEYGSEFEAIAINDGTPDYLLRLTRLVPEYNVIQLKKMEITANGRKVIPLGVRASTIDVSHFRARVAVLGLTIELKLWDENRES